MFYSIEFNKILYISFCKRNKNVKKVDRIRIVFIKNIE